MKTRLAGLLVVVLTVVALTIPQPASAARRWQGLLLSTDGRNWTPSLQLPLFERDVVLVPGTEELRTFYVRNQSRGAARLSVTVLVSNSNGLLERSGLTMGVRTNTGRYHRIRRTGQHKVAHLRLARGKMVPVTVRVLLRPRAGNMTMDGLYQFVVRVRLTGNRK
jgi:hypothetical protein